MERSVCITHIISRVLQNDFNLIKIVIWYLGVHHSLSPDPSSEYDEAKRAATLPAAIMRRSECGTTGSRTSLGLEEDLDCLNLGSV